MEDIRSYTPEEVAQKKAQKARVAAYLIAALNALLATPIREEFFAACVEKKRELAKDL